MFCPRTQQQCYNPECGKTTGICDPSQPINYSTAVYTEEYVKQLLSTIEEYFDIIKELVELKMMKDSVGKTDNYLLRQPLAWKAAFDAIQEKL